VRLEALNLSKEYSHGDESITALQNVNFTIKSGEFISVTGRSGSGKSTLFNLLAGLTTPTSGSVLLDGADISNFDDREISLYRNQTIGCVPQFTSLLSNLTVFDNVRLPYHLAKREGNPEEEVYRLLQLVGLEKLAKRRPARLSGGQVRRAAIARALMNKPTFLFADEPTCDLDASTTQEIMTIFEKVSSEGTAVLMISHDLETTCFTNKHFEILDGVLAIDTA